MNYLNILCQNAELMFCEKMLMNVHCLKSPLIFKILLLTLAISSIFHRTAWNCGVLNYIKKINKITSKIDVVSDFLDNQFSPVPILWIQSQKASWFTDQFRGPNLDRLVWNRLLWSNVHLYYKFSSCSFILFNVSIFS